MSNTRAEQFRTETPFLPQPLAGDVLEAAIRMAPTLADAEAQYDRLRALRKQVSAAVDTVELAIATNHANYVGGRHSWSYETSNEVKQRLRTLKRQRQHLQEAFGACNRRIRQLQHSAEEHQRQAEPAAVSRALQFVRVAEVLLEPETLRMLWELVDRQLESNGITAGGMSDERPKQRGKRHHV